MKTLLLIDGNALLHRGYHGLPPLTSPTGELVNAVFGFFSMFLKVLQEIQPSHIIVCFDRPKPTFRQALFAGYHQHRPKMSDDLVSQIVMVHEMLEKMHIAIFEVDGYEADDLIGTIAHQASTGENGAERMDEVIILSGDRDLLQLVTPTVKVLAPVLGITKMILNDEGKVEERFGVKPSQFIDYKALVGDQSDGYPGVTGIGPKTAADLIRKFGTFENLYKHLADVPPKIMEKLALDAEQAALAKKLATIIKDAPVRFDCDVCHKENFDSTQAAEEFQKLGMKSLLGRLPTLPQKQTEDKKEQKHEKAKEKNGDQLGLLDL